MNYRFVFFIGTGYSMNGTGICQGDIIAAKYQGRAKALKLFGGLSESEVTGSWKTSDNKVVAEKSWRIEVIAKETGTARIHARQLASYLRNLFAQESVLLTMEPLEEVDYVND